MDAIDEDGDDLVSPSEAKVLSYVYGHEMGHIFGFLVDLFEFYVEPRKGVMWGAQEVEVTCTNGTTATVRLPNNLQPVTAFNNLTYYEVTTHHVKAIAQNYFNCDDIEGIRLDAENDFCLTNSNWHPVRYFVFVYDDDIVWS